MKFNKVQWLLGFLWIVVSLYVLLFGILWLFIGMFLLLGIYLFLRYSFPLFRRIGEKAWFYGPSYLFLAVLSAIVTKVFLLEICEIPSESMENTLFPGDQVIINKLSYGPRMPRSIVETPWLHSLYLLFKGGDAYSEAIRVSKEKNFQRWKGFSSINRGDVIVFEFPQRENLLLVKRFVALPGDTILMNQGELYVNGVKQEPPLRSKEKYYLWPRNQSKAKDLLERLDVDTRSFEQSSAIPWKCILKRDQYQLIQQSTLFDSLKTVIALRSPIQPEWHEVKSWTENDFGPLVLPSRGLQIKIDSNSLQRYGKIIKQLEKSSIDDLKVYTFRQDYSFAMGDYRSNSIDSRRWGLIPEDHIVGRAYLVLFSRNKSFSFFKNVLKRIR